MKTLVDRHPELRTKVVVVDYDQLDSIDATAVVAAPGLLVVDGFPWTVPMAELYAFRERKVRRFDSPFKSQPEGPELKALLATAQADLEALFKRILPTGSPSRDHAGKPNVPVRLNWRPMITCGEPLHFDTFHREGFAAAIAYANVSPSPRYYAISHTYADMCRIHEKLVKKIMGPDPMDRAILSSRIRNFAISNEGPLGRDAPKHFIQLSPGAVWFFVPRDVSHEVLYGDCTFCFNWHVPEPFVRSLVC